MFQKSDKQWKKMCAVKEEEIIRLKEQLKTLQAESSGAEAAEPEFKMREKKTFSVDMKILDQCVHEAAELKKQKAEKLKEVNKESETVDEEQLQDIVNTQLPVYELDSEMLEELVVEFASYRNEKNREIEDLKAEISKLREAKAAASALQSSENQPGETSGENSEARDEDAKHVSFLDDIEEENGNTGGGDPENESVPFASIPLDEVAKTMIRHQDLNNVDVLLATLVKDMQDVKTKINLIEKSVVTGLPYQLRSHGNTYHYPGQVLTPRSTGFNGVTSEGDGNKTSQTEEDTSKTPQSSTSRSDNYKSAYLQKSFQLEQLQRELLKIKADQRKMQQLHLKKAKETSKNSTVTYTTKPAKPTSSWSPSSVTTPTRSSYQKYPTSSSAQKSILKSSANESKNKSQKGKSIFPKPESNSDDDLPELYNDYATLVNGYDNEEGYQGRIRDSDDFDWTKGVDIPSMAFSQEALDRGHTYLRKVAKKYEKENMDEQPMDDYPYSEGRYGVKRDVDNDMIERILRKSFVETEQGLEYRRSSYDIDDIDY